MKHSVIAIDQSTSATKVMLFSEKCEMIRRINLPHRQIYLQPGWVEHDAEEIYLNTVKGIAQLLEQEEPNAAEYSIAITNQRETVVIWNRFTGKPIYNAVVWQCMRGQQFCNQLKESGYGPMIQEKTGLLIDPYFSASGAKWILDNVEGARQASEKGELLFGTIDSWLIWKLTGGKSHVTDYTNASRTLLMNIHSLKWDKELLNLFTIPQHMMPQLLPGDSIFGETTVEGLFRTPVCIAGVLGDSHGALAGQMCFEEGLGKATYGTGSSVMVNIGEKFATAPTGLVTSIGFSAFGKLFYAFEGNIHCTGATIKWLQDKLQLIESPNEAESWATKIDNNGGVYLVPAFAGLGAPWWQSDSKAMICGMTLGTGKAHIIRAALESIAYQITDLVHAMTRQAGISLKEIRVDGGPTRNKFLMQFQADCLRVPVNCSDIEEASAFGAVIMNGIALKKWKNFAEIEPLRKSRCRITPGDNASQMEEAYKGWQKAVKQLIK